MAKAVHQRIETCKDWLEYLLSRPKLAFDSTLNLLLPKESGIYHIAEKDAELCSLYVGEADNLRDRILRGNLKGSRRTSIMKKKLIGSRKFRSEKRAKQYLHERCFVQYVLVEDKRFRRLLKYFLIGVLNPKFND